MSDINEKLAELDKTVDKSKGENYYARKFKNIYVKVRKALVILNKNRKDTTNQVAYEKAIEFISSVLEE